jgi:hypothetical protein
VPRDFFSAWSGRFDARWQIACEIRDSALLCQGRARQEQVGLAQLALRQVDGLTRAAYHLKRALDDEMADESSPLAQAYALARIASPSERTLAECLILGGASDEIVACELGCAPAIIAAFCGLFFDVRGRTRSEIVSNLMPQGIHDTARCPRDVLGAKHRFALFFGWEQFLDWHNGILQPSAALREDVAALAMQALKTRLVVGEPTDELTRAMAAVVARIGTGTAESHSSAQERELAGAIGEFLLDMDVRVADPTDPVNINLPAREPRAHELIHPPRSTTALGPPLPSKH